ncbi:MAG: glycosyltransferase family 39 protein [Bacteriovorax sp.]|nr:glycosyltransferase family 39 protein [Bacteriovorax sp.]
MLIKKENHSLDLYVFVFFLLVASVIYFPTLKAGALWDDWIFIFKSQNLKFNNPLEYWGVGNNQRSWPMFFSFLWVLDAFFSEKFIFYHIVSLVLHTSNAFLLYKIMPKLGGRNAGLIALLYLVHPLHFFSVTWIIQLKTLMCIFFFLLAAISFLKYRESNTRKDLVFSIVLFAFSLLSKAAFAPILILFLFFKERKVALVFISLCIYSLLLTFWSTHVRFLKNSFLRKMPTSVSRELTINPPTLADRAAIFNTRGVPLRPLPPPKKKMDYPITTKFVLALKNFSNYSLYVFYPKENLLIYPNTVVTYSLSDLAVSIAIVLLSTFFIVGFINKKKWISLSGLLFFIISIVPLTGITYWSIFAYSNFVEYWLCVPVVGLIVCLSQENLKRSAVILVAIVAIFYAAKTFESARVYTSSDAMILKSIERSPKNVNIKLVLANHYFFTKRYELSNAVLKSLEHQVESGEGIQKLEILNYKALRGEDIEELTL